MVGALVVFSRSVSRGGKETQYDAAIRRPSAQFFQHGTALFEFAKRSTMHPDHGSGLARGRRHICPYPLKKPLSAFQPKLCLPVPWRDESNACLIQQKKNMIKDNTHMLPELPNR